MSDEPHSKPVLARDEQGRILPGQGSLNPGGRPKKLFGLVMGLNEHVPHAVEQLVALLDSEDPKVRITAVKEVLDRVYGKPHQAVVMSGELTVQEVLAKAAAGVLAAAAAEAEEAEGDDGT